jgi:uncharacterized C2H2 Zn-finger protein
VKEEI